MDITQYVETLREDLARAASAMGPETEEAANRLGLVLDSSVRLALMEALSAAAADITTQLPGTSVEVRLSGRDPHFVVVGAAAEEEVTTAIPTAGETTQLPVDEEGAETARVTLRLPDALKARAEELAAGRGQSLNTWLVNAIRAATSPDSFSAMFGSLFGPPGAPSPPGPPGAPRFGPGAPGRNRSGKGNKRVQGWAR